MGGIGKTSLAFRYAMHYKLAYGNGIFHFNAESLVTLHASLDENINMIKPLFKKPQFQPSCQFPDQKTFFWRYLKNNCRALLIFDSANHFDRVTNLIPPDTVTCHVIITTRKSPEHLIEPIFKQPGVAIMKLHYFEEEQATKALLAWSGKDPKLYDSMNKEDSYYVKEIALQPPVEGLPIAIAHAGAFIQIHKMTFNQYWQILVKHIRELKAAALDLDKCLQYFHITHLKDRLQTAGVNDPEDLKALDFDKLSLSIEDRALLVSAKTKLSTRSLAFLTWEMDIDEVQKKSREGYAILSCCSIFSSRDIPHSFVVDSTFSDTETILREYFMAVGLGELNKFCLIYMTQQNDGLKRYDVHHLIQSSMVQRCMENIEDFKCLLLTAASCISKTLPNFDYLNQHLDPDSSSLLSMSSHIYSIARHMLLCGLLSDTYPGVIDYACVIALAFQHLQMGKELCSLRLRNFNKQRSQFEPKERNLRNLRYSFDLGEIYKDLKVYGEAERYFYQAIKDKSPESMSSSELAENWFVADRLAVCFHHQGAYKKAEKLFLRIVDALDAAGSNYQHVSTVYNNLAAVYKTTGQLQQLHALLEKSLSVRRLVSSVNQLDLAQTLSNLGLCLFELGNYSKSLKCFEEALEIQKALLPKDDIRVAKTLRHMGSCFAARGQHEQNKNCTKEAMIIAQASLDCDDGSFAYYLHDYGFSLVKIGKFSDGISLLKQSLALWKQQPRLPEFDRAIAKNLNFLGFAFEEIGKVFDALKYYVDCLQLQKEIYNSNHPDLISTLNNIGLIYGNCGETEKARFYLNDAFKICETSLPPGHPQTCAAAQNLGYCLVALGQAEAAQQIARKMIRVLSVASPSNPAMIQCFQQLFENSLQAMR